MKKIADISKWQGKVDWEAAAKELEFVVLRASCGQDILDSRYLENVSGCVQNKIPFGAYHYVKAGNAEDAQKEARFFLACVQKATVSPVFYIADIEYEAQTESTTEDVCVAFLKELRAQGCKKIGMYINRKYKWAGKAIEMCDVMWIPHWGKDNGNVPEDRYKPEYPHDLWQYTSKGTLPGVKGDVDLNQITGTKPLHWFTEKEEEKNMAYVMTAKEMVEKALDVAKNYKTIYMYAAYGFQVTTDTINGKAKQNLNGWYTSSNIAKLKKVANQTPPTWGFDCVNLYKALLWGWNGDATKEKGGAKYGTNGVPDTNANGLFDRCSGKTTDFSEIVPGEAVWIPGHFGMYVGNGLVVECTPGWDDGVQITYLANVGKVSGYHGRTWNKHGKLPYLDYGDASSDIGTVQPIMLGDRMLKKGCTGNDVKQLQERLILLGYDCGSYGADGDFGAATERAVKAFQKDNGLEIDGIFGEKSFAKMEELTQDNGGEITQEPEPEQPQTPDAEQKTVYTVTGGSVYLWDGHPAYGGQKSVIVYKGDKLEAMEAGEYLPVVFGGTVKWINKKYV